jgi:hypothetical protein
MRWPGRRRAGYRHPFTDSTVFSVLETNRMNRRQSLPLTAVAVWFLATEMGMGQLVQPTFIGSVPDELHFGCVGYVNKQESAFADSLSKGQPAERMAAARQLWDGHSRGQARAVLQFVDALPDGTGDGQALKRQVAADLQPEAITRELRTGDYRWGAWLAYLRPSKEAVPELLAGLDGKPDYRAETVLALGASRDPRAIEPLRTLMKGGDGRNAGYAARALGDFGSPSVEAELLELVTGRPGWAQLNACHALAHVGTEKSLPALEALAGSTEYTGALDIRGVAMRAVVAIEQRERPADATVRRETHPRATLSGHKRYVWAVSFSPDGSLLASVSDDRTVRVWNMKSGKLNTVIQGHARQMTEVVFVDNATLAAGGWGDDGSVRLFDVRTGDVISVLEVGRGGLCSLAASRDSTLIAASGLNEKGSAAGTVKVFDRASGKQVADLEGTTGALAFRPDGKVLATNKSADVQLWDVASWTLTATLRGHSETVTAGAFSPDGCTLATGGDWTTRVWNTTTGEMRFKVRGSSRVRAVTFSPDGRLLAVSESGGPVRLLEGASGRAMLEYGGKGPVAFSADGKVLATGADGADDILLWDVPTDIR